MLERLKAYAEGAKNVVIFILTPIAFVIGYIFYLLNERTDLENELRAAKGKEKLDELKQQEVDIDTSANGVDDEYQRIRQAYLRGSDQSVRPGSNGKGQADQDPK